MACRPTTTRAMPILCPVTSLDGLHLNKLTIIGEIKNNCYRFFNIVNIYHGHRSLTSVGHITGTYDELKIIDSNLIWCNNHRGL